MPFRLMASLDVASHPRAEPGASCVSRNSYLLRRIARSMSRCISPFLIDSRLS